MVNVICKQCRVVFREGERALWCGYITCPQTPQRGPTEIQFKKLRVGEPFDVRHSDR